MWWIIIIVIVLVIWALQSELGRDIIELIGDILDCIF